MPKGLKKAMIAFGGVLAAIAAAFALLAAPVSAESGKPTKEMLEQQNALAAYDDLYEMVLSRGSRTIIPESMWMAPTLSY